LAGVSSKFLNSLDAIASLYASRASNIANQLNRSHVQRSKNFKVCWIRTA
jgi:hypothetical protein